MLAQDFIVHLTRVKGDNLNRLIEGYVEVGERRIAFEGLVASAQPGPNVNVSIDFPASELPAFEALGLGTDEIEELKALVQQKIMDGDMTVEFG